MTIPKITGDTVPNPYQSAMTEKTIRRKFLKAVLATMAGVAGVGFLFNGTTLGETERERTFRRTRLLRQLRKRTAEHALAKPDADSSPIFSLDEPLNQGEKTSLYDLLSQENGGVFHENQVEKQNLYDLVSPIPSENNANDRVSERVDLLERLKKLGIDEPPKENMIGAMCYYW